jgi:protein-S-isoprenylcysteine O-methyltransferase Ste14
MRIMPPTLFLICILISLPLAWIWPVATIFPVPLNVIGVLPLIVGLGLAVWGSRKFEQVGTTIKTFDEPDRLVTDGLFKHTRNPMYLGFVTTLVGVSIILGALSPLLVVLLFVGAAELWYIPYEERALREKFGRAFLDYASRTRRWI